MDRDAPDVGCDLVETEQDVAADIRHPPNAPALQDQPVFAADNAGYIAAIGEYVVVRLALSKRPPFSVILARPCDHVGVAVVDATDKEVLHNAEHPKCWRCPA